MIAANDFERGHINLLFLDIDGVLNSARSMTAMGKRSSPQDDVRETNFDPIAVGLLRKLCEECDLRIFIHSSWWSPGYRVDKKYMTAAFRLHGWKQPRVIGGASREERAERISRGLREYKPKDYIILDDADMRPHFDSHAIVVNSMEGFSFDNYAEAMRHFGKKEGVFLI